MMPRTGRIVMRPYKIAAAGGRSNSSFLTPNS